MTDSSHVRKKVAVFLAVVALSAITMVWLFWRFPLMTAIITVVVLLAGGLIARLARSIEVSEMSDIDRSSQLR